MKTTTRVCIIGGGVVGCSVAYHLTKLGWSDVMLLERSELTSGSTWHAAGGFHTLNGDTNMAALQGYTIRLYRELEALTGMSCGLHHVGGVTLADTPERLDMLKAERAKHRYMGMDTEIIGPDEIKKLSPITNVAGVLGGLYDPLDGHIDPSGTTNAYAKAARMGAALTATRSAFPNPTARLRSQRSWPIRAMALPACLALKVAASKANSVMRSAQSRPLRTSKSGRLAALAYRFQGQTRWQSSQP